MKIAIDGPAGSGKSTIAKAVSKELNFLYLDTGAMYRSCTWACLQAGVDLSDTDQVIGIANSIAITFQEDSGTNRVFVDGVEVTKDIRSPQVDAGVSYVAAIPEVRQAMVEQQRLIAQEADVVAEGRDIGTVVFPDAEVKIFLTADPAQRALRRVVQREGGDLASGTADVQVDEEKRQQVLENLISRDKLDSSRKVAPLKPAADAHHMDTSHMTIQEELAEIRQLVETAAKQEG